MKESPIKLALVVIETEEEIAIIPIKVQPLLVEYQDVLTDSLPSGLPHLRDIQHAIDLVSGSLLPNRPVYRLRLVEYEELQLQVIELM